jgi:hypothetical protein
VSALGANRVQDWKCDPNAATMLVKPGLGHKALKHPGLQCHRVAAPM